MSLVAFFCLLKCRFSSVALELGVFTSGGMRMEQPASAWACGFAFLNVPSTVALILATMTTTTTTTIQTTIKVAGAAFAAVVAGM